MNYFSEKELSCTHCGEYHFDEEFLELLNHIREECGFPLPVTSGYRCPGHPINIEKAAAGKPLGAHSKGLAVDIAVSYSNAHTLLKVAVENGVPRIGINQKGDGRFIHLDCDFSLSYPTIWSY